VGAGIFSTVSLTGNPYNSGILIILISCIFLTGAASAQGIQAYLGDTIPLSGYSPTSPWVYLFLTGPNLPGNGVALNNINLPADQGGFTKVSVDGSNDMWTYKWGTNSLGGRLDAGTYTIWVVDSPNDMSNLANADYDTISVTLSSPTISVNNANANTPTEPPSLQVSSEPADSSVSVDGQYLGKTPFSTDTLPAGTHTITVSRFGYASYSTSASLVNGGITVVNATLPIETGELAITTDPSGANVSIDGKYAGISPSTVTGMMPGNHTISVTKDGYNPSEQQVTITAGSTRQISINLTSSSPLAAVLPRKTPAPLAGMLLGLCASIVLAVYFGKKSR
jgi:PEGA domain